MGDWVTNAMNAPAPGETRCGVQVPHLRFRGETDGVDEVLHRLFPRLAVMMENHEKAKQTADGWAGEVRNARAEVSRLQNLVLTASGEQGGRDVFAAREDVRQAEAILAEAEAGHAEALREVAVWQAAVERETPSL